MGTSLISCITRGDAKPACSSFTLVIVGHLGSAFALLSTNFVTGPKKIAYHAPCHLRAQNIGLKSRDLLRLLPAASVQAVERCCGVDGTWGVRKQYHDLSLKVGAPLFDAVKTAEADVVASDCPLAGMQITQGTGAKVVHPLVILRDAYGL